MGKESNLRRTEPTSVTSDADRSRMVKNNSLPLCLEVGKNKFGGED